MICLNTKGVLKSSVGVLLLVVLCATAFVLLVPEEQESAPSAVGSENSVQDGAGLDQAERDARVPVVARQDRGSSSDVDTQSVEDFDVGKYRYSDIPDDRDGQLELLRDVEREYRVAVREMESVRDEVVRKDPDLLRLRADLDEAQNQVECLLEKSPQLAELEKRQEEIEGRISQMHAEIVDMAARLRDDGELDYETLLLSDSIENDTEQADQIAAGGAMRELVDKKMKYRDLRREHSVNKIILADSVDHISADNEELRLLRQRISGLSSRIKNTLNESEQYRLAKASVRSLNNKRLYLHRVTVGDENYVNK